MRLSRRVDPVLVLKDEIAGHRDEVREIEMGLMVLGITPHDGRSLTPLTQTRRGGNQHQRKL